MKNRSVVLTVAWLMLFQINQFSQAQQKSFTMHAPVPSAVGNYYMLKLTNHDPLPASCHPDEIVLRQNSLYRCVTQNAWGLLGGVWNQDIATDTVHLSDVTNQALLGVAIGTTQKELKLTIENGGIISTGEFGSNNESLVTTGTGARLIWYPKKGAFRAGVVDSTYPDAFDEASLGNYSFAAGLSNKASGEGAAISGGRFNISTGLNSSVGGGSNNFATGEESTVGGGHQNQTSGEKATISGGNNNIAGGQLTAIGGGTFNMASAIYATVAGGSYNRALAHNAAIVGGSNNQASGLHNFIGGGTGNQTSELWSLIVGGENNTATAFRAMVLGGSENDATGNSSLILQGSDNDATGTHAIASGTGAIAAGDRSIAIGYEAVAGGIFSYALGDHTTVDGHHSLTFGDRMNVSGSNSIGFGSHIKLQGSNSFVFGNYASVTAPPPLIIPWDETFAILSDKVVMANDHSLPNNFPAKLNVSGDSADNEDIAAYFDDLVRIKPRSSPPACNNSNSDRGKIYVSTDGGFCFCNGASWDRLNATGSCTVVSGGATTSRP